MKIEAKIEAIKKVLVANRGVSAFSILSTCKEMGIPTVAIFTAEDWDKPYLSLADEKYFIGEENGSGRSIYMNIDKIVTAGKETGCNFVHLGTGMGSENAEIVKAFDDAGIKNIGASHEKIKLASDKIEAIQLALKCGVPVKPGSHREVNDVDDALAIAERIGYPVMLKPSRGGGGKGIKKFRTAEALKKGFATAKADIARYCSGSRVYMEKFYEKIYHIEIQVMGGYDKNGNYHVKIPGGRNCTIQREDQKIVEEAPPPFITKEKFLELKEAVIKIAESLQVIGVFTVEFVINCEDGKFYFSEINLRIQVEKGITEMIYRLNLIKLQILLATGSFIDDILKQDLISHGHAIEFRIYVERTDEKNRCFVPIEEEATIIEYSPPSGDGIEVDSGVCKGSTLTHHYDGLIALFKVWAETREKCIEKAYGGLKQFKIKGKGVETNIDFHLKALENYRFLRGDYDSDFVKEVLQGIYDQKRFDKMIENSNYD